MNNHSILAFLEEGDDWSFLDEAMKERCLNGEINSGGIAAAIDAAKKWAIVPEFLVLDVSRHDDPIKALEELSGNATEGETNVILVGETNTIELYRALRAAGAAEYLIKPVSSQQMSSVLAGIIRERQDQGFDIDPERLIVVTGTRGGAGTSTVAASLAYGIAEIHKKKTLLLDLDLEGGTQHVLFNTEATMGLIEFFESPARIDSLSLDRTLERPTENIGLLSSYSPMANVKVNPGAVKEVIVRAYRGYDVVVVDLPARSMVEKIVTLSAGLVVVVTPPTLLGIRDTAQMFNFMNANGYVRKSIVVVNKLGEFRQVEVKESEFHKRIQRDVLGIPYDPKTVTQSLIRNAPLLKMSGRVPQAMHRILARMPTADARQKQTLFNRLLGGRK